MQNKHLQHVATSLIASLALTLPLFVLAHGGVDDGHVDAQGHALGADALLRAFSLEWWMLLLVSLLLMTGLSLFVRKYLTVDGSQKKD